MKWFPFQGIVSYAADNIECPAEHLKLLLKLFSMFKTRIIYDDTIDNKGFPEDVGIICINCVKIMSCLLYNQTI